LGTIVYLALAIGLLVLRKPAIAGRRDGVARGMVMGGTFGGSAIVLLPAQTLPAWALGLSCVLILIGSAFSVYALFYLGRSFSLMAEARQLVTTGPYKHIRHPLYLGEQLSITGVALLFVSPLALFLLAVQMACQLYRMNCEEQVLANAFPDYDAYKARTMRLVPGLY
jgi:protein-S-isoprenylcysteine O-methyltransferase Ste14